MPLTSSCNRGRWFGGESSALLTSPSWEAERIRLELRLVNCLGGIQETKHMTRMKSNLQFSMHQGVTYVVSQIQEPDLLSLHWIRMLWPMCSEDFEGQVVSRRLWKTSWQRSPDVNFTHEHTRGRHIDLEIRSFASLNKNFETLNDKLADAGCCCVCLMTWT